VQLNILIKGVIAVKKVVLTLFALLLVVTGCSKGGTNTTVSQEPTKVAAEANSAVNLEAIPSQSSTDALMRDVSKAYHNNDMEALSKLIVPTYFGNVEQKTPSVTAWIASETNLLEGKTVTSMSVTNGVLNPKFTPSVIGLPLAVLKLDLKAKDADDKEVPIDPIYLFPVKQDDKYWLSLKGAVLDKQLKDLNYTGDNLFAFLTSPDVTPAVK
jgi:hypothetical protein